MLIYRCNVVCRWPWVIPFEGIGLPPAASVRHVKLDQAAESTANCPWLRPRPPLARHGSSQPTAVEGLVLWRHPDLAGDDKLIALPGHQPPEDLFRPAGGVDVGAVKEIDPRRAAAGEHPARHGLIGSATEAHGAKAQPRNRHPSGAKSAILHGREHTDAKRNQSNNGHARRRKRLRWHIDYLSTRATMLGAIVIQGPKRLECRLAGALARSGALPIRGFGCSDCRCPSHLYRLPGLPVV